MSLIVDAAASGDELEALRAMRDVLAAAMDDASVNMVAQISARLQAVLERITVLAPAGRETISDVLAERRASRVCGSEFKVGSG